MLRRLLFLRYRWPLSSTGANSFSSTTSTPSPYPPPPTPPKGGGPLPPFGVPFAAAFVGSLIGGFSISSYTAAGDKDDDDGDDDDDGSRIQFEYSRMDLQSDEAVWILYERWCRHYKIQRSRSEMEKRFDVFKSRAIKIYEFNNLNMTYSYGTLSRYEDKIDEDREEVGLVIPSPSQQDDYTACDCC